LNKQATSNKQQATMMMLTKAMTTRMGRPMAVGRVFRPATSVALWNNDSLQDGALRLFSAQPKETPVSHAMTSVLKNEFPGYYDKKKKNNNTKKTSEVIDVHDRRADFIKEVDNQSTGHRLLTCQQVVHILEQHPAVDECVVIDINVEQNGEIPVAFVTRQKEYDATGTTTSTTTTLLQNETLHEQLIASLRQTLGSDHQELEKNLVLKLRDALDSDQVKQDEFCDALVQHVRDAVGPFAILKVVIVDALPKTSSGKILRGTLYRMARGQPYSTITPTIENPNVLRQLELEIKGLLGNQYNEQEEKDEDNVKSKSSGKRVA
jgi:acyl-CoA synthetase (AMP-forming)/AMP-acid ligase II